MASSITEKKHFAETGHCRIWGHRKQWTDELQSRISELEKALREIEKRHWGYDGDCGAQVIISRVLD